VLHSKKLFENFGRKEMRVGSLGRIIGIAR
jgi:hypothetical protein